MKVFGIPHPVVFAKLSELEKKHTGIGGGGCTIIQQHVSKYFYFI